MKPLFSLSILLIAASFMAGCSLPVRDAASEISVTANPAAAATGDDDTAPGAETAPEQKPAAVVPVLPNVELTPKLLLHFLLAEIAGQRGLGADAAELYRNLARETRDPRIARRATELALHARNPAAALNAARLWADIEPDSALAHQTLISVLASQGHHAELKLAVATLLAAEPHHIARNLMGLNRLLGRSGDRQGMQALIETATTPYLHLPEAHYIRARAAFEAHDPDTARSAIRRALEIKPDWESAALFQVQLIEKRPEAMAALADFIAANPKAGEARMAYARALVGDKRYSEARREFNVLLEQSAKDSAKSSDVVFAIAVLSLQLNDTANAEKHLRRLVEIGHGEADKARYYLGQIAEEDKRWDEALKWFAQVGQGEHYLPARLHAASVLSKRGQLDLARRQLTEAEVDSPSERVQLLIGEAQILRDAGRLDDAYAVLAAGLVQQPEQPELLYEIALLAERMGRKDETETRLRRLIELRPDHAHALNALGYSLVERNERLPEANELIERALQLAPNDPFILDSKGWVLFRQGNAQAALEMLNKALGIRADPEIAAHLGEVLWSLGRRDEARQTWEKARRESPANETLAATIKRFLH